MTFVFTGVLMLEVGEMVVDTVSKTKVYNTISINPRRMPAQARVTVVGLCVCVCVCVCLSVCLSRLLKYVSTWNEVIHLLYLHVIIIMINATFNMCDDKCYV